MSTSTWVEARRLDAALCERYRAAIHALRRGAGDGELLLSYVLWPTESIEAAATERHGRRRYASGSLEI